jgi:predicted transcriptional regulator
VLTSARGLLILGTVKTRKATTVRLDAATQQALATLSTVLGCSQNQIVTQAVQEFVAKRSAEVALDLEATLAKLRAYRRKDPTGVRSMAQAMAAEAAIDFDPAEGIRVQPTAGPVSAEMLEKLSG